MKWHKKLFKELWYDRKCHNPIDAIHSFMSDNEEELEQEIKECYHCQLSLIQLSCWIDEMMEKNIIPNQEEVHKAVIKDWEEARQKLDKKG